MKKLWIDIIISTNKFSVSQKKYKINPVDPEKSCYPVELVNYHRQRRWLECYPGRVKELREFPSQALPQPLPEAVDFASH